jgi:uncharacterized protein (TIGR02996 family)
MNEEQGFLAELREHPDDDVTRLVYADWLEERGDGRAAYLRADVALAKMAEGDEGYAVAEAELVRLRDGIESRWLEQTGKRWDVVFLGHSPYKKVRAVVAVREAIGEVVGETAKYGLDQALALVESAPSIILVATIRSVAEYVREKYGSTHLDEWISFGIVPNCGGVQDYFYEVRGRSCKPIRWQPSV